MGGVVGFFQAVQRYVRINLSSNNVCVAEQLLNRTEVRSPIKQMSRIAVPQFMRGDRGIQACARKILL